MGAIIGAALIGVAGAGIGAAMQPGAPDYGKATVDGIIADINTLPFRRMIEAAVRQGKKITVDDPNAPAHDVETIHEVIQEFDRDSANVGDTGKMVYKDKQTGEILKESDISYDPSTRQPIRKIITHVPAGKVDYDFTGMGDADNQIGNAQKLAPAILKLQQQYGPAFIAQRLKELRLSNPNEMAARDKMFQWIMAEAKKTPDTTMTKALSAQLMEELQAGGKLSPDVAREVEQDIRKSQAARGNIMGNAPAFEEAMSVGSAAEKRKADRQARALAYLQSGTTADDVNFRKFQQSIANLGDFTAGKTPSSQFGTISGAQQGAVPFVTGEPMTTNVNPNAGQSGVNAANQTYNTQAGQPNPWLRGIATGINAYTAFKRPTGAQSQDPNDSWGI